MLLLDGADGGAPLPLSAFGPFALHYVGRRPVGSDWSTDNEPPYRSIHHSIMRILAGSAEVEVDGRWFRAGAGELLVIPAFRDLRRRTSGFDHAWITFSSTHLAADLHLSRHAGARVLAADQGWDTGMAAITAAGNAGLPTCPPADLARLEATILRAVGAMLADRGPDHRRPADTGLVHRAAQWLDQHYRTRPSLAEIAHAVACSPNHLHTRFSADLGLSPAAYGEQLRLRDAYQLLVATALPVQEVARRCGYEDAFHFARVVRRRFGRSPRQIRTEVPVTR